MLSICSRKYQLKEKLDRSFIEMSNFMDDKNEVVLVVRDKLKSRKKQCAVMHNNFVNKTLNYTKRAKRPAD